jgi:endogenous inhibitor of DNA gyrase (YacG/DUF329 family)
MSKTCPLCDKPTDPEYAPFCTRRCADVDLQRWLSGLYAIPAVEAEAPDEAADGPRPSRGGED